MQHFLIDGNMELSLRGAGFKSQVHPEFNLLLSFLDFAIFRHFFSYHIFLPQAGTNLNLPY